MMANDHQIILIQNVTNGMVWIGCSQHRESIVYEKELILKAAMEEYGAGKFAEMELVTVEKEEVDEAIKYFSQRYNSVWPFGYNSVQRLKPAEEVDPVEEKSEKIEDKEIEDKEIPSL